MKLFNTLINATLSTVFKVVFYLIIWTLFLLYQFLVYKIKIKYNLDLEIMDFSDKHLKILTFSAFTLLIPAFILLNPFLYIYNKTSNFFDFLIKVIFNFIFFIFTLIVFIFLERETYFQTTYTPIHFYLIFPDIQSPLVVVYFLENLVTKIIHGTNMIRNFDLSMIAIIVIGAPLLQYFAQQLQKKYTTANALFMFNFVSLISLTIILYFAIYYFL